MSDPAPFGLSLTPGSFQTFSATMEYTETDAPDATFMPGGSGIARNYMDTITLLTITVGGNTLNFETGSLTLETYDDAGGDVFGVTGSSINFSGDASGSVDFFLEFLATSTSLITGPTLPGNLTFSDFITSPTPDGSDTPSLSWGISDGGPGFVFHAFTLNSASVPIPGGMALLGAGLLLLGAKKRRNA